MKITSILLVLAGSQLVSLPLLGSPDDERKTEAYRLKVDQARELQIQERIRECAKSNHQAAELPADQAIPLYGETLVRLGGWQRPDTLEVYHNAQAKLLSIPGHATFYRDKIKALQEQMKSGKLKLEAWSDAKHPYFEVLKHLPSEETVEVLGEFAMDKFAFAYSTNPEDLAVPGLQQYKYSDYSVDFTVCGPAMNALAALGIEDPPVKGHLKEDVRQALWSQWWKEVKEGKRKYRFKGSDVLHPVNAPLGIEREVQKPGKHTRLLLDQSSCNAEQAGADQPATKLADKAPVKDQPPNQPSKDIPR